MSKTYLIETSITFTYGYAVVTDDDMDPRAIAEQLINDPTDTVELYQYHTNEKFEQCIPLKPGQVVKVFKAKNGYISNLSDEEIVGKFMMDFRKNEEEK